MLLKIRRLCAICIDFFIVHFGICVVLTPISHGISFFRDRITNFPDFTNSFHIILVVLLACFVCLLFFLEVYIFTFKDVLFGYESLGKKVMQLKIYNENNERIVERKLLVKRVRDSIWLFNIYPFMILLNNKVEEIIKIIHL